MESQQPKPHRRIGPTRPSTAGDTIHCRLDELLQERQMTLVHLSSLVGLTVVNLSIIKNDRARSIRFGTLEAICEALDCTVGDLLVNRPTAP